MTQQYWYGAVIGFLACLISLSMGELIERFFDRLKERKARKNLERIEKILNKYRIVNDHLGEVGK